VDELTPEVVRNQMTAVMSDMRRAPTFVMDLETAAEEAELAHEMEYAKVLLTLDHPEKKMTVEEKKSHATLATSETRREAFIKRSAYNRAKTKTRLLESELNGLQSQLRSLDREGA